RRAHRARAAHGVRPRAQPPHRAPDGRIRRLMTSAPTLSTDHSRATADGAHSHGAVVPQSSRADRRTSFDLADFPVAHGREGEGRCPPLSRVTPLLAERLGGVGPKVEVEAAPEVRVTTVGREDERLGRAGRPGDRTAATSWASFTESTVVTVPRGAVASAPTTVRFDGGSGPA